MRVNEDDVDFLTAKGASGGKQFIHRYIIAALLSVTLPDERGSQKSKMAAISQ